LIENLLKGKVWTWAVIGIGININQTVFSPEAPNPVSLKQITGRDWDILSLQEALSKALNKSIQDWLMMGDEKTIEAFDALCVEIK
jgi:BirA family biotin operon repressor/biotin-[acetyl-CoA-carboxylase] ligase